MAGADCQAAGGPCACSVLLSGFKCWSQPFWGAEPECMSQAKQGTGRVGDAAQPPTGARSISHRWTFCLPPLAPAAHSASQLSQGHEVRPCLLSFQCNPPEQNPFPLQLHRTLQPWGTGNWALTTAVLEERSVLRDS